MSCFLLSTLSLFKIFIGYAAISNEGFVPWSSGRKSSKTEKMPGCNKVFEDVHHKNVLLMCKTDLYSISIKKKEKKDLVWYHNINDLHLLRAFMRQKGCNFSRWSCGKLPHPKQQDGTSCGVFALKVSGFK